MSVFTLHPSMRGGHIMPLPFEIHQLRQLSLARGPCAQGRKKRSSPEVLNTRRPRASRTPVARDFGKCFKLDVNKEVMPYGVYTYENVEMGACSILFEVGSLKGHVCRQPVFLRKKSIKRWYMCSRSVSTADVKSSARAE